MFAISDVNHRLYIRGSYCNAMFIKRQAQELRFMTQQKLHSARSTGTAAAILMSPDLPVLRAKVWLAKLDKPGTVFLYKVGGKGGKKVGEEEKGRGRRKGREKEEREI